MRLTEYIFVGILLIALLIGILCVIVMLIVDTISFVSIKIYDIKNHNQRWEK